MDFLEIFGESEDLVTVAAGGRIFTEGEVGDAMYILIEGEARITLRGEDLGPIPAGEIIGEMVLIDDYRRGATISAVTDCRLAVIDRRAFTSLIAHVPDFSLHIMQVLARRLRGAYGMLDA